MKLKITTDKILTAVIGLLLLSISSIIIISISETLQVNKTAKAVTHTQDILFQTQKIMSLMLDNETGSRGYILTGKKEFLEPLYKSKNQIGNELSRLKSLIADNPAQQRNTDSLAVYIDKRIAFSDYTVSLLDSNNTEKATAIIETGQGKYISDKARFFIMQIQSAENISLTNRKAAHEKKISRLYTTLRLVIIGSLLLLGFFFQKLRTDFLAKRKVAAELASQNEKLEERVLERTNALKKSEAKLIKANRLYFFISQVNQMIVRTTDEATLFKEACRIAVELGKFRMAWIGILDEATKKVVPVMHAGEQSDYLSRIKPISVDDVPEGMGPTGKAIREGKYLVCNDIENDPDMLPWRERALSSCYLSSMALPIIKYGKVIGAFSFYAAEKNFFDDSEIALLEEATGDVAFALEVFEKEALHKKAEDQIIREKNISDSIINSLPGVFYLYNQKGKFLRWNKKFETVTLYNAEEISRMNPLDFFDAEEKELLARAINNVFSFGEDAVQAGFVLKTKEIIPYYFTGVAVDYEGSPCLMGVGIDFSERVKAQEIIKENTEQLHKLTAHLINIREEERKRIGREIHDELGQQLTAIKMDVAWIDKKTMPENEIIKDRLKNTLNLISGANQSIRRILNELRPLILDDYGLLEAMEWHGQQFTKNTGVPIEFNTTGDYMHVAEDIAVCVFRIYQETLTNITRYANAHKVWVLFAFADNRISLQIEDDGTGFDTNELQQKKSFGILGMKERVFSMNGNFELVSAPGRGTKVKISLPLIQLPAPL